MKWPLSALQICLGGFIGCYVVCLACPADAAGINLWLWRNESNLSLDDVNALVPIKPDLVRVPFDPRALQGSVSVRQQAITALRAHVNAAHRVGHHVVLDCHPDAEFKQDLRTSAAARSSFLQMWLTLDRELSHETNGWLSIEFLNEPGPKFTEWWRFQLTLATALRAQNSARNIVANAEGSSSIDELTAHAPYALENITYNFHFYEPMVFTHQGAPWSGEAGVSTLQFPFNVEEGLRAISQVRGSSLPWVSGQSGAWNDERIRARLRVASAWAAQFRVRLSCNEFGAYRLAPRSARLRWAGEVASTLSNLDIEWAYWSYTGDFGLFSGEGRNRHVDEELANSLGLK